MTTRHVVSVDGPMVFELTDDGTPKMTSTFPVEKPPLCECGMCKVARSSDAAVMKLITENMELKKALAAR